jgi:hypothetical protein
VCWEEKGVMTTPADGCGCAEVEVEVEDIHVVIAMVGITEEVARVQSIIGGKW